MLKNTQNKVLAQAEDGQGGKGVGTPPAKVVESKAEPAIPPAKVDTKAEGEGNLFDELGYEKAPAPEGEKKPETKKLDVKPDAKVEKPVTGYAKEPDKIIEEVVPPVEVKPIDLGFELKIDEIIPKDEVNKLKELTKTHSLSKEAAQTLLDMKAADFKKAADDKIAQEKAFDNHIKKTRADWYNELKADPGFGGDKFDHNVMQAEKVLEEFMPGTKKQLTERGSVLPPYVMRDLAKLADHLYSTERLTQGEPTVPEQLTKEDDPLAFYNQV